jgi:hypothetical protein
LRVRGRSLTRYAIRGALYAARRRRPQASSSSGDRSLPGRGTTYATTRTFSGPTSSPVTAASADPGMALEHALDLVGRDAVAEAVDQVVLPSKEPDVAVRIAPRVVAGQEPLAMEAGGGLLGLIPVAQQEGGVVTRNAEHPLLVRSHLLGDKVSLSDFSVSSGDVRGLRRPP